MARWRGGAVTIEDAVAKISGVRHRRSSGLLAGRNRIEQLGVVESPGRTPHHRSRGPRVVLSIPGIPPEPDTPADP
ncbi:hypothetical protein EEB14_47115 [Rhodococcus sp. WS4]|nr:hypothetical protein EEB14_47115 [Rhodococcus sp. WS4]